MIELELVGGNNTTGNIYVSGSSIISFSVCYFLSLIFILLYGFKCISFIGRGKIIDNKQNHTEQSVDCDEWLNYFLGDK